MLPGRLLEGLSGYYTGTRRDAVRGDIQPETLSSWRGAPLIAVSAEVTVAGTTLDDVLTGPRLRTRKRYASAPAGALLAAGFGLLPTFSVPHYGVVLGTYTGNEAQRLVDTLGPVHPNPQFVGKKR